MLEKLQAALAAAKGELRSAPVYLTELQIIALEDLLQWGTDRHREILEPVALYWRSKTERPV